MESDIEAAAGAHLLFAYATLLFDAIARTSQEVFDLGGATELEQVFRSEFARLLGAATSSNLPPDDLAELMAPLRGMLQRHKPGTPEYVQQFGTFVAELLRCKGDPHVIGQVAVQVSATLKRLRIREVMLGIIRADVHQGPSNK